jgi:toxin ParE1/3/4
VRLRYSEDAIRHIDAIHAYIAERNPIAATRVVERIRVAAERLLPFPEMARAGVVRNTREWDELVILAVFHGAQDRQA